MLSVRIHLCTHTTNDQAKTVHLWTSCGREVSQSFMGLSVGRPPRCAHRGLGSPGRVFRVRGRSHRYHASSALRIRRKGLFQNFSVNA